MIYNNVVNISWGLAPSYNYDLINGDRHRSQNLHSALSPIKNLHEKKSLQGLFSKAIYYKFFFKNSTNSYAGTGFE